MLKTQPHPSPLQSYLTTTGIPNLFYKKYYSNVILLLHFNIKYLSNRKINLGFLKFYPKSKRYYSRYYFIGYSEFFIKLKKFPLYGQ